MAESKSVLVETNKEGYFEGFIEVSGGPGIECVNVTATVGGGGSASVNCAKGSADAGADPTGTITINDFLAEYYAVSTDWDYSLTFTVTLDGEYLAEYFTDAANLNKIGERTYNVIGLDLYIATESSATPGDGLWVKITHTTYPTITATAQAIEAI